jgi:hypothetical protein
MECVAKGYSFNLRSTVEDYIGGDDPAATEDILIDAEIMQHSLCGEF